MRQALRTDQCQPEGSNNIGNTFSYPISRTRSCTIFRLGFQITVNPEFHPQPNQVRTAASNSLGFSA